MSSQPDLSIFTSANPMRIWINQTYATNYWILGMIKDNPDNVPVSIYASSDNDESPVLQAADFPSLEPDRNTMMGNAYVDWALDFCHRNRIDVFVPMRGMVEIAARVEEFHKHGVKVLVSPADAVATLDDKNLTYLTARKKGIAVPPWRLASTAEDMEIAYRSLEDELEPLERICIKPIQGVGASGFREIVDKPMTMDDLLTKPRHEISLKALLETLALTESHGSPLPTFMLLPFLDKPEISVDCLSGENGEILAAIPRSKRSSIRSLDANATEAIEVATQMSEGYNLKYLTNTQIRWFRGEAVLLETNTRISGGMYASTLAGINMAWEGIKLAYTGETSKPLTVELGATFTNLSSIVPFVKDVTAGNS